MDPKALAGLAGATIALILGAVAGAGLAGGGLAVAACSHPPTAGGAAPTAPAATPVGGWQPVGEWDSRQVANAATIVAVGQQLGIPARGWVVAVATAMQESRLRNLPGGDRDSLGVFQQRPSQGWGTPAQILDPVHAATRFYTALTGVPGWQNLPLTVAAQTVQRSGFPDAYAEWEPDALALVNAVGPVLTGIPPAAYAQWVTVCAALGGDGQPAGAPVTLPPGFALPADTPPAVRTAIDWALAQLGTPYSYGGDCTAPHSGDPAVGSASSRAIPEDLEQFVSNPGCLPAVGTSPVVAVAVGWALAQVGAEYSYGGDCTAPRSGVPAHECDCSSLMQMAYRVAGVALPRTTGDQVHAGAPVHGLGRIRAGDLVFIPGSDGTATVPGHVGMYVGQGLLVHAPGSGQKVQVTWLSTWVRSVAAIRRIAL
jgi:cell wall-associated NlpC family hydrolase